MKLYAVPFLAAATASSSTPQPGLWEITSAPQQATLDGRPLGDLPYTPPAAPDRQCFTAADLADPAALVARQAPPGCTVTRRTRTLHGTMLTGTCPPQADGLARGSFRLTGSWRRDSYSVRFTTANPSENGVMGFTGRVDARRVGACPPG